MVVVRNHQVVDKLSVYIKNCATKILSKLYRPGLTNTMKLHTFGCSITQGFALPDIVQPLTEQQLEDLGRPFHWMDVHLYKPSEYALPSVLAAKLNIPVINHARRGACFQQIARQCAVSIKDIQPNDIVIVMWTYLSRLSFQWPARTSVPLCNMIDPHLGWFTTILPGWNKFFGLSPSPKSKDEADKHIHEFIEDATNCYLTPMGLYNQFYNSLVLQQMTDGFLTATGARVIHLSVEPESYTDQLEDMRQELDPSLKEPYNIPHPNEWYTMVVDHSSCRVILDPSIPPAENDMHPSVTHHKNFADHIYNLYFQDIHL